MILPFRLGLGLVVLAACTTEPSLDAGPEADRLRNEIVFIGWEDNVSSLWRMREDGTDRKRLPVDLAFPQGVDVSPDGGWLTVVDSARRLFIVHIDGSALRELTDTTYRALYPAWSPDGQLIAFEAQRTGTFPDPYSDIYVVNVDGRTGPVQVTQHWAWDGGPSWSPDGSSLAFWSSRDNGIRRSQIYIVNLESRRPARVTHDLEREHDEVDWSPDGVHLLIHSWLGSRRQLELMRLDGAAVQVIGLPFRAAYTAYGNSFAWKPDGTRIAVSASGSDLWSIAPDGSDPINLTQTPWPSPGEPLDGLTLEDWPAWSR